MKEKELLSLQKKVINVLLVGINVTDTIHNMEDVFFFNRLSTQGDAV
jgi:hypothetical protein